MSALVLAVVVSSSLTVSGCGATRQPGEWPGTASSTGVLAPVDAGSSAPGTVGVDVRLPEATATFSAHFTDPIYEDQSGDFAPFGSDEGWDMLQEWAGRRNELNGGSTVAQILQGSDFGGIEQHLTVSEPQGVPRPGGQVDAAVVIIGAGFTLLRLTGHIDQEGKALTLKAIDVLMDRYGSPPQLARVRADLQSWHD